MEFRFELSNGYSYEDMLMLCRAYVRKSPARRWLDRLCRLCLILLGGAWILSALSWLDGGYVGETPLWVLVAWPMFIGLLLLALGLFWDRLTAWGSRRRNLQNLGHISVCLNEDTVVVETKKGTEVRPYSAFTEACAYKEYWLLFLDKRHAEILPQTVMTVGNPDAFPAFWAEKTGMPIKKIK